VDKNPLVKLGSYSQSAGVKFSLNRIIARMSKTDGHSSTRQNDFLDHYLEEKSKDENIDVGQVLGWLLLNVRFRSCTSEPDRVVYIL
jgi:hypothetical protein